MHKIPFDMRNSNCAQDALQYDAGRLADAVADIACGVFSQLGPGMPKSVYQLMLCRQLSSLGVMLESERLLDKAVHTQVDDEILSLDRCLLVQCTAADGLEAGKRQCALNLLSNNYQMAMVIEFGEQVTIHRIRPAVGSSQLH